MAERTHTLTASSNLRSQLQYTQIYNTQQINRQSDKPPKGQAHHNTHETNTNDNKAIIYIFTT